MIKADDILMGGTKIAFDRLLSKGDSPPSMGLIIFAPHFARQDMTSSPS